MERKTLLLITILVEGGLFVIGLLLMGGPGALRSKFILSWCATGYALLLCLPMFAALYFAVRSKWGPTSRLQKEIEEKIAPIFANCKFIDLAMIAFLAGLGEELFFRGWLQGALSTKFEAWMGILVTSAIFGLTHYLSLIYAIYAFITGIYLGTIFHLTENLYIVMAIHAVYDFIALLYLAKKNRGEKIELQAVE